MKEIKISKSKKLLFFFYLVFGMVACHSYKHLPNAFEKNNWKVVELEATPQNPNGDAGKGYNYMIYGDYIGSGIPWTFLEKKLKNFRDTVLKREGKSGKMPYLFNVFDAPNGVTVAAGNCFTCHASEFNNEIFLGLGNSFSDFTKSQKTATGLLNFFVKRKYKKESKERAAFQDYGFFANAISPYIKTKIQGVNPAFRVEEGCVNYRESGNLKKKKQENFDMMKFTLASDVPPLWNVKKKNALYYNGMGRGDFTKLLMQAAVLGIPDSTQARKVNEHFVDVLAWLESLKPPPYPQPIDKNLAIKGQLLFEENCAKCHGFYGEEETYPNKLVSLEVVKTDPYYVQYFTETSGLANWYNKSWFGNSEPVSSMEPSNGYIAPPLDGIWATAPYLHNGSIPNLDVLLNSPERPTFWQRSGKSDDYNYEKVGWNYKKIGKAKGDWTYDTTIPGYGNRGHYFGDKFSDEERRAVVEYLKTL